MDYKIRTYERGDEYQIVKLFKEVFHRDMIAEQWKWKYEGQGFSNNKSVVAIDKSENVIGHFGAITVRVWFMDRFDIAYQAVDEMVDERHRGGYRKGLYYHLGSFFWENINSFKYGFVNLNHMRLGKIIGFFEDCISVKDHSINTKKYSLPLYKLEQIDWDDIVIDVLWKKIYKSIGWSMVRDREFLKWRFKNNPFYTCKLYGLKRRFTKGILGWIVVKEMHDTLFIMDMLFGEEYMEPLLKKVLSMAYREDKKKAILWLNNRYDDRLKAIGFQYAERSTYVPNIIKLKICDSKEMNRNLYFTMADTDFM